MGEGCKGYVNVVKGNSRLCYQNKIHVNIPLPLESPTILIPSFTSVNNGIKKP